LDTGGFAAAVEPGITVASQPQENTLRRKIDAYDRVNRHQKTQIQEQKSTIENQHSKIRELQQQLGQLSGKTRPSTVSDAIPDMTPRWVYFATPSKANRIDTFDFAYNRGIVCCDVMNAIGALKPNVGRLRPGDLMLLAYGKDGVYEPKGYLTIEKPYRNPIDGTEVLHELPNDMTTQLERAGYSRDPSLGVFTGFRVTPSSVRKGQIPDMIRKPNPQQNFLRTWEDVRKANGWHKPETPL
jgi:hypothetical protein